MGEFDRQWEAIANRSFVITRQNWIYVSHRLGDACAAGTTAAPAEQYDRLHTAISQDAAASASWIQLSLYPWCLVPRMAPVFVMDDVIFRRALWVATW